MTLGIGLFSGGLDSILAVKVLQEQDIHIELISFITPFFGPQAAQKAIHQLNVPLHIIDITDIHLAMLKDPKHGYGRNMNPCIDCHALMFNQAGRMMQKLGADFLFSGEVLGERPMSQNKQALRVVAKESGFEEVILRPLSARLLPETAPEHDGRVNRERLLAIKGRSRKPQMDLVQKFGIATYPNPAGGCRLTDPGYSKRLRDLFDHTQDVSRRDLDLLSTGRHFRLPGNIKMIIGRNRIENDLLEEQAGELDLLLTVDDIPGPTVLIPGGSNDETLKFAAAACARYSDAPAEDQVTVTIAQNNATIRSVTATACDQEVLQELVI